MLADTSVWIDHLRRPDPQLTRLLERGEIACHPIVAGEISLGSVADRARTLGELKALPRAHHASEPEVEALIESERLWGCGIGYVDAHLLAACRHTPGLRLWTRDRRLADQAERLGVGWSPA